MTRNDFYRTDTWREFRKALIAQRIAKDGQVICERCGKPIVAQHDIILHHMQMLTDLNWEDANISLNPSNIAVLHHACHQAVHAEIGRQYSTQQERSVWLVWGAPLSGKSTYVESTKGTGDVVVDVGNIWKCVGDYDLQKPKSLAPIVFRIRDELLEDIATRNGSWEQAWIVGCYPLQAERERLCKRLCAREIFIDTKKEECLLRTENFEKKLQQQKFVNDWFALQ